MPSGMKVPHPGPFLQRWKEPHGGSVCLPLLSSLPAGGLGGEPDAPQWQRGVSGTLWKELMPAHVRLLKGIVFYCLLYCQM